MVRLPFSRTTIEWMGVGLLLVLIRLIWFGRSNGARKRLPFESELFRRHLSGVFLGAIVSHVTVGGAASSMASALSVNFLDVRQRGFYCVLYGPTNDDLNGRADSGIDRGAWRFAR
jgi:hypothetical protein